MRLTTEGPRYKAVLEQAVTRMSDFRGHALDVLDISKPPDLDYAVHLSKVVSKLSPMLGNMIEYRAVNLLNEMGGWGDGSWVRQDPGFPDTIFAGNVTPVPGIEIKTWFPLATEITARFKDSITHFEHDQTAVAMLAWVPEHIIYGRPRVIDVWVDSARGVAAARDAHYHDPPDYLVFEPEDTSARTSNLQQTNTNGYKFQGTTDGFAKAQEIVASWGPRGRAYDPSPEYQAKLRELSGRFTYRLDTNYSKMDRIEHPSLERFKAAVHKTQLVGYTIKQWAAILRDPESESGRRGLARLLGTH